MVKKMYKTIKSTSKPKARIGIISEVMGYRDSKKIGREICLNFRKDDIEFSAWFRKADIDELFSVDYSKLNTGNQNKKNEVDKSE